MRHQSILKSFFILFAFTFVFKAYCQGDDSVLKLKEKVNKYYNNTTEEKLFVHTDRSFYLTGEIIWFKIYCVDASLNRPLHLSKVAYVEILDPDRNSVLQAKVSIDGTGEGSLFLPSSLNSGNYLLRAYTNWMKNFSADLYFHQNITIVNPFIKLSAKPADNKPTYDVQFFPEGGNLVYGMKSKVAFRAVDKDGTGIDFNGAVTDETNNVVAVFKPLKFGIGNFVFTPGGGHQYKATITDAHNRVLSYDLPSPHDEGFVMSLIDSTSQVIIVNAQGSNSSAVQPVYLLVHSKQNIIFCEKRFLQSGATSFMVDKQKLKEGITHFTLFADDLQPACDRLYFKTISQQLRLDARTDVKQYATRKKVRLDLAPLIDNKPSMIDLSVSVYRDDSLQSNKNNIVEYLELSSELTGNIESPSWYLSAETSIEKALATDNLMLTHGWSRFTWNQVLSEKNNFEYIPEIRSHVISGSIKNAVTGQPEKNVITFLVSPEKNPHLFISKSNTDGRVQFETQNFFGSKDIAVTTRQDSAYTIQLINPFSDKYASLKIPSLSLNENIRTDLEARALQMQVQNVFYEKALGKVKRIAADTSAFYGRPDNRYFLDDFTRFPTMEEVMREYVAEVLVRKHNKKFFFYNIDEVNKAIFQNEPLVLLDGVPVFSTDKIMAFDPRKIKRLDVLARTYFLGALSFQGVISYSTYKGDLGGFQLDPKTLFINYEATQTQREFFSPVYETMQNKNTTLPDTRNLLYWSSLVKTDQQGKAHVEFYTSDVIGKFNVDVQGLSKEGKPINATTSFEVKEKLNY
jgi:hypothetical protein